MSLIKRLNGVGVGLGFGLMLCLVPHSGLASDPIDLNKRLASAQALLDSKDYGGAFENYDALLADKAISTEGFAVAVNGKISAVIGMLQTRHSGERVVGKTLSFSRTVSATEKLVSDFPRASDAPKALYELGRAYFHKENWDSAEQVFQRLLTEYPQYELSEETQYHLALVAVRRIPGPNRSQVLIQKARTEIELYRNLCPKGPHDKELVGLLTDLREMEAEFLYNLALFFRKRGKLEAYKSYLNKVTAEFSGTKAATHAREDLSADL